MSFRRLKCLSSISGAIVAWTWVCSGAASANEPTKDILSTTRAAVTAAHLTPYDVGSRYAQALGASETCPGGKLTDKGAALGSLYTGAHLEEFSAQEKKIYDAWLKVKHCVRDDSPGQCKVIIDESCAAALTEVGPSGTAFPGLLEISRP
jgi:hypothetical protein